MTEKNMIRRLGTAPKERLGVDRSMGGTNCPDVLLNTCSGDIGCPDVLLDDRNRADEGGNR